MQNFAFINKLFNIFALLHPGMYIFNEVLYFEHLIKSKSGFD